MIKVNSKVKLNFPRLKQLQQAQAKALGETADALQEEMRDKQVIPRRDGALQGESFYVDKSQCENGKVILVHAEPYARNMYFNPEYNFHKGPWEETIHHKNGKVSHLKHDGNPNAKGEWFEDWMEDGKYADFAINTYRKKLKELTGR